MQDSVCWVHLEFTGSFYGFVLCKYMKSSVFQILFKTCSDMTLFHFSFLGLGCHMKLTWYQGDYCSVYCYVGCQTVFTFSAWCFWGSLRFESSRLRFCCCYCCYFFSVCYAFSKRFDIFIVIILICIKKLYDLTCFRWPEMGTYLFVPFQHMKDWGNLFPLISYFKIYYFIRNDYSEFFSFVSY